MLASSGVNPLNRFQFESLALLVREHEGGGESEGGEGEEKYRRHFRSMANVFKKFVKYTIPWKRI
jgi:hypothetical protein